ncbi:MAG: hypothetical protein J4F45_09625 [Pseudomonadales bacterium]|nr:hypothetical protein [Pseudomonadales bacterium]
MKHICEGLVDPRDVEKLVCPLRGEQYAHSYAGDAEPVVDPEEEDGA